MKMFPIQSHRGAKPHPTRIPWEIADLAYSVYSAQYGRDQSLEKLAERGGFSPIEMDDFLPDWRERCSNLASRADVQKLIEAIRASVARADDYGDSYCSQPIREALKEFK